MRSVLLFCEMGHASTKQSAYCGTFLIALVLLSVTNGRKSDWPTQLWQEKQITECQSGRTEGGERDLRRSRKVYLVETNLFWKVRPVLYFTRRLSQNPFSVCLFDTSGEVVWILYWILDVKSLLPQFCQVLEIKSLRKRFRSVTDKASGIYLRIVVHFIRTRVALIIAHSQLTS